MNTYKVLVNMYKGVWGSNIHIGGNVECVHAHIVVRGSSACYRRIPGLREATKLRSSSLSSQTKGFTW